MESETAHCRKKRIKQHHCFGWCRVVEYTSLENAKA